MTHLTSNQSPKYLRALSAEVIFKVLTEKASLNDLQQTMLKRNLISASSVGLFKEITFGVMRNLSLLETILNTLSDRNLKNHSLLKSLILVGLYQLHFTSVKAHAVIFETVDAAVLIKRAKDKNFINAILRNYQREYSNIINSDLLTKSYEVKYSFNQFLITLFKKDYPKDLKDILSASNTQAPMWLRVNKLKCTANDYLQILNKEGIKGQISPLSDTAIMLETPVDPLKLPNFNDGYVYIQDISAQLASIYLNPEPNDLVLDCCCAPGGKTTHLIELCPQIEHLVAIDLQEHRLKRVSENLERLNSQLRGKCSIIEADATSDVQSWSKGRLFDKILLDAPCSALGVIRRHPDIKWLRNEEQIASIIELQEKILNNIWQVLKPNGQLLYATCSIHKAENSERIKQFLKEHNDAQLIPLCADDTPENPGICNLPGQNYGDGFYYAKLKKLA
jgi:16S rRNA (cytosine967-C5)-methyltransferase